MQSIVRRMAAALAAALALTGCAMPDDDPGHYRGEAVTTLEAADSRLGTTRLTLRALLDDRLLATSATVVVTSAEEGLAAITSSFSALQPPRDADPVRQRTEDLLEDAQEAVAAARIAVRRGDRQAQADALRHVDDVTRRSAAAREQWS